MRDFGPRGGGGGREALKLDKPWGEVWPHAWALMQPRRMLLAGGFGLMLINRICGLVLPTSTKYLVDDVIGKRDMSLLGPILGFVLLATAIQGVTSYALTQTLSKEANRLVNELRLRVQTHIARLPLGFYDNNNTGSLVSRVMSDVDGIRNLLGTGLIEFVGSILTSVIALGLLLKINVAMTAVAFVFVALFSLSIERSFKTIRPIFRERRKIAAEITGRLTESISGVRVVKGYRAEARESAVFGAGLDRLLQNIFRTLTATSVMDLSSKILLGGVAVLLWYMGIHRIVSGAITLGDMLIFNIYLGMLVAPMVQMVSIGTQLSEAFAGLERTHELLQMPIEDDEPRRQVALARVNGDVAFDQVTFAYDSGPEVLHEVTFTAPAGTVTALVGPSGSGKSTIIGLVSAFYTPRAGAVRVDEVDLATVELSSYRSRLGVVLQETFLFDGTIRENVMFARPAATEEQFLEACRIARVDEFAEKFKLGYGTIVGERGVKLSGGQRQRLTIARAILADPRILILDEATSSLDSESEALIQAGLSFLMKGRTTFVIAHRLSTIRAADQILVIEEGRITERGTHTELLAERGRYFDLYTRQHGLEENLFLAPGEGDVIPLAKRSTTAGLGGEDPSPESMLGLGSDPTR